MYTICVKVRKIYRENHLCRTLFHNKVTGLTFATSLKKTPTLLPTSSTCCLIYLIRRVTLKKLVHSSDINCVCLGWVQASEIIPCSRGCIFIEAIFIWMLIVNSVKHSASNHISSRCSPHKINWVSCYWLHCKIQRFSRLVYNSENRQ